MLTIASFEFRSRLKLLSTWVYFAVFFALSMLWISAAGGLFKDANISFGSGKVAVNSPFALAQTVSVLGMFGITIMAAIMGRAVQQDFEHRTHNFFFTSPIGKLQYLGGRFVGAFGVVLLVFTSIGLGAWLATLLPGMDPERLGANRLASYLLPYGVVLIPNVLWIGAIFFALAALTRKMLPVYIGSVLVLVGWLIASQLVRDIDNKAIAALLDPFGSRAISVLSEYWTVAERNTRLVPLEGVLLWNRALWVGLALLIAGVATWRFSFAAFASEAPGTRRKKAQLVNDGDERVSTVLAIPRVEARPDGGLRLLPHLVTLYFRETVKNVYFSVLVLAGILFLVFASTTLGDIFGTRTWPHTFQIVQLLNGSFALFMLVLIAFYAGELVWRERESRLDQIADALPTPTWLPLVAKLLALMLVPLLLQAVLMLCGMAIQLAQGFTRFDIPVYLEALFGIDLVNYWLLCALAIALHSVVNHKYVGHFLMIVYYVVITFSSPLGLEHNLYKFGNVPNAVYSDMNGWGHFLPRVWAFQAYWAAASVLLLVAGHLMWTRGTLSGWRERLRSANTRLTGPTLALGGASLLAFVALGGFIFYNTNVLNIYHSTRDRQQLQVEYERKYKALLTAEPQPKVTDVALDVALYPREQHVRVRGRYVLQNKNAVPVATLNLQLFLADQLEVRQLQLGVPAQLVEENKPLGLHRYKLAQPLAPGATTTLDFDVEGLTKGFANEGSNTAVVYNGSFLNGRFVEPLIGYQEHFELERDQDRRKFGLAPKDRLPDRDDAKALQFNPLSHEADWVNFEVTLSTEPDQIAIAPGYLQREWTEGGRRFFHYKMDAPILNFYAFQSARYAVRKDVWHGNVDGKTHDVAIEIYHQPGHEYNLAAMIDAVKASLDYDSRNFGPYQYRQFRIVEFPRYETFAQSFPNTIPYSEQIGFIARVRPDDDKDIDYPFYVTAHEAGHQWWGHQVIGADVQGGTMLIESFAQYSALMVLKHRIGPEKMRKFLRYELDRYLTGRAFEQKKELPLSRVENQPYIHYSKGSLVMYALADYIGEDKLNQAIREFRDANAFKGPPYPNTTQFLAAVRKVTPPEMQYLIDDMFDRIVLYDNHAVSAKAKALAGGRWEVAIDVTAKKRVADELGHEQDVPLADLIDIGVVDAHGNAIAVERQRIDKEAMHFTLVVDKKPVKAGIDPLNKLIDRRPEDNTVAVTFE